MHVQYEKNGNIHNKKISNNINKYQSTKIEEKKMRVWKLFLWLIGEINKISSMKKWTKNKQKLYSGNQYKGDFLIYPSTMIYLDDVDISIPVSSVELQRKKLKKIHSQLYHWVTGEFMVSIMKIQSIIFKMFVRKKSNTNNNNDKKAKKKETKIVISFAKSSSRFICKMTVQ